MAGDSTLPEVLSEAALAAPGRVAVEVDGLRHLTYGGWAQRSDALAAGLQSSGVLAGQRIALMFDLAHWDDYAVAYLAAQKMAAVPVPLHPEVGGRELDGVLRDCRAAAIVAAPGLFHLDIGVRMLRSADLEEQGRDCVPIRPAHPAPLAEVLYRPRALSTPVAIPRTHRAVLAGPDLVADLGEPAPLLHTLPVGGLGAQDALVASLSSAAGSVVIPRFDPERLCALLSAVPGRACALHPAIAQALLDAHLLRRHDLSGVPRLVLTSGGVSPGLLAGLAAAFPTASLLLVDVLGHGPEGLTHRGSEPGSALRTVLLHDRRHPDALGRPQQGTIVWVADENGRPVRTGAGGRVWVRTEAGGGRGTPSTGQGEVEGKGLDTGEVGHLDESGCLHLDARRPSAARGPTVREAADRAPTPTEQTVAAMWQRVLRRRSVEVDADFFALGGGAFAATMVLSLIEDAFGVRVSLGDFLAAPTVAGLSAVIERDGHAHETAGSAPVAFSQEGMLWHEHFVPGCQNLPGLARRYRGPLDVRALGRALDEIVRRHQALRTTFELRGLRLQQVVRPHRPLRLATQDLSHLPVNEREAEVERLVADAGRRPFELVTDALFEPTLLRLAADEHVLVIRTHHSVFDDWSVGVFRRELATLYTAFRDGAGSPLPEPPLQFADFSRHQRRELAGRAGTRELAFWRRELDGAPLTTQLPVDDPEQPEGSPQQAGDPVSLTLPARLHEGLRRVARRERATLFMTMLAAYGALVHRYTGQDDLLLATVVANRNRTELEGMIGCFTKKVPLRLRLAGDPSFTEALARTRTALMGALAHQDLPFEAVIQDVLGSPAASHGLVPHVALVFQGETPRHELHLPDVETTGFETSTTARRTHFMAGEEDGDARPSAEPWGAGLYSGAFVIVSVAESADGLSCIARGAFHAPAVRRLLETFRVLLTGVADDPTRPLSELPLLDDPARAEVLDRGRGPAEPLPADTLCAAFAAQLDRGPDAPALRTHTETLTYADLDVRSARLARRLSAVGVKPGATVGVSLGLCVDLVVAVLAVWKAGAALVALDPADTYDRLARIVEEASLRIVISDDPHGVIARLTRIVGADGEARAPASTPPAGALGDPAVVFYGSGPSAIPRGAISDHRAILNLLTGLRSVHQPDAAAPAQRVHLCAHPTSDGFVRQLVSLLDGHTLHLPDHPVATDPAGAVDLVGSALVDVLDCAPQELPPLLEAGLQEALRSRPLGSPEPALVVGTRTAMGPELWRRLRNLTGVHASVVYGPPECGFGATALTTSDASARPTVGRPLANVRSYVLAADGRPLPERAVGELHLGGPRLSRGDVGARGAGEEAFRKGTEHAAERLYRTGRRARWLPDGNVELLGGVDDDTDLRGFSIDPLRVRAALAGGPGVRGVDVTLHHDEEGETRLVAHVTPDGQPPTLAQLRAHLWERLPGYAFPSAVVVGRPPAPSHTGTDAPPGEARETEEPITSPAQRLLSALWAEVLGVEHVEASANYWQRFSFLEVLARAREVGLSVIGEQVTRNRTVETLTADLQIGWPGRA